MSPTPARWCLGLRSTGVRPLQPPEYEWLRGRLRLNRRCWWYAVLICVLSPLTIGAGILLAVVGEEYWGAWAEVPGVILAICGYTFLPAAGILMIRDAVRDRRAIRRDVRDGIVEEFGVDVSAPVPAAVDDGTSIRSAIVLPHSRQVLWLNGSFPARPMVADVFESAPPPGDVAHYAVPSSFLAVDPPGALGDTRVERRRLTSEELVEIAACTRRFRRPTWGSVVLTLWMLGVVTYGISTALSTSRRSWAALILPAVMSMFAVRNIRQFIDIWRAGRGLNEDRLDGWVLVLRASPAEPPVEVLPHSKLVWSTASAPSPWRLKTARPPVAPAAPG